MITFAIVNVKILWLQNLILDKEEMDCSGIGIGKLELFFEITYSTVRNVITYNFVTF